MLSECCLRITIFAVSIRRQAILTTACRQQAKCSGCRVAQRAEMEGKLIVPVLPSFGERYLSTVLFNNLWCKVSISPVIEVSLPQFIWVPVQVMSAHVVFGLEYAEHFSHRFMLLYEQTQNFASDKLPCLALIPLRGLTEE